ncbi:putative transglutaminase-like cysteine proteinase [Pseudaminobacter salicylatoxidans]|uniref:Putative transglutaminase-like cysteine proteinase n=1 Tax=Pseudaminobacter salicylatoxidans TaxID=93369 RepID=A0A316BMM1_PSESE|nr:transglutaminase-like cysteine peptidase [Pseudaminobacter salicylatoxidans]PWJ74437.1 putative transglutaminase-like cysteine proteinase [Pseudaminobacter salicylatoxidans]
MNSSPKMQGARLRAAFLVGLLTAGLPAAVAFAGAPMATGGLTSQPIGHYEFCKANPAECALRPRDKGPERMTGALWKTVTAINLQVNRAIKPMSDMEIYGKDEVWAYPDNGVGDCEDYVLEKRRELMSRGVSLSNLLITVVRKPDGEGHAVLTLRTDKGDFVLDNLTDAVRQWDETGYRFLKRQASNHTGHWVGIREGQAPLVGAVQ